MKKFIYCPANSWDCPYCTEKGGCTMRHPEEECDDYYAYTGDEEEEEEE